MSLADAGFLIALIDPDEPDHGRCLGTMNGMVRAPLTTWPAISEAMYMLGRRGWPAQDLLWRLLRRRALVPRDLTEPMQERCYELMATYRDLPMALADASLVALAETERDWQMLTLDGHFRVYRPRGRAAFDILPED